MVFTERQTVATAEQLYALPDDGNRYELIEGVLFMMSPAGSEHGRVAGRIFLRLATHVEQHKLGETARARPETARGRR